MATTNLFSRPVFKEGAFTANDPAVRRLAVRKTFRAIDLGVELGATVFVMWGGREGVEAEAAKNIPAALDRYAEAVNLCCAYAARAGLRPAVRARAEAERAARRSAACPLSGMPWPSSTSWNGPRWSGLNPEFAHETMSGLNFTHAVAQCLWQRKLFHIDLNAQRIGKFDQDFRFGSEGIRDAFYLVKLLEDSQWPGMRHFDAHAYRTEDPAGVWDFARGCMRTYLILRDKARRFADGRRHPGCAADGPRRRTERAHEPRRPRRCSARPHRGRRHRC